MLLKIEEICQKHGIKLTENRRVIARIIAESKEHLDVEEVLRRANKINPKIGIATVYRTLKILEECGAIAKHEFGGTNKAHYETMEEGEHHDHLIDVSTGKVYEFFNLELEKLKDKIAADMGYELVGHRLELYCKPLKK
jgi:Fur family ferric uptake transcriptional regulator